MIYASVETSFTRMPQFVDAEPMQQATWLVLLLRSCEQENSGVIAGCRDWSERMWLLNYGVSRDAVMQECGLWCFEGNNLHLYGYPLEMEKEQQEKRGKKAEASRANGAKGGRPKTQQEPTDNPAETQQEPSDNLEEPSHNPAEPSNIVRSNIIDECENAHAGRNAQAVLPRDADEVARFALDEVKAGRLQMLPADAEETARKWFSISDGRGWVDARGMAVVRWQSAFSGWARIAAGNTPRLNGRGSTTGDKDKTRKSGIRTETEDLKPPRL